MQLFTGHDIIISRSIREAQKNETLGSLPFLRKKKKEIAGGIPRISSQPNTTRTALPSCTRRDEEALQTCLAAVQGGRVVFVQHCVHYPG